MKYSLLSFLILALSLLSMPVFSQEEKKTEEVAGTGLPGDNLDLYAVLDLFQKSKTIEEFEKSLNAEETKINNLDLNLDEKVDFIKVETKQKDDDFSFILQVPISEKETQDVAVILVSKDKKDGKEEITLQIVGDKDLYGKDYIVEPQATPGSTANPGYKGEDPITVNTPATTVVEVQTTPIVQYVYSPAYVPYYPPYYYGYYPPYYNPWVVPISIGIYAGYHSHYHHHHGYGHGNTTIIHNENNFNNYNGGRNNSNTVADNKAKGNYRNNGNPSASTRPSAGTSNRPSTGAGASTRPSTGAGASTRPSTGSSASTRPSNGPTATNRASSGTSASSRPSSSASTRPSSSNSSYGGSSRTSSSSSMGASRSMHSGGGGYSGGGARAGGGGGGRRR